VASPTGDWVCEILLQDAAWLTDVEGQREYSVIVRPPAESRDPEEHLVLRALGSQAPSAMWVTGQTLELSIPAGTEVLDGVRRASEVVNVVVREEQGNP